MRTLGVEEELLLVDEAGRPAAVAPEILEWQSGWERPVLEQELQQEMLEVVTPPCETIDEVADAISRGRIRADIAARGAGARAVAFATSPVPVTPHVSPAARVETIVRQFGRPVSEALVCGMHVHVAVDSPEEGVAVLDRIRVWLPALLALSTNSPFWRGEDSGHASYRHRIWGFWPSAGPNPVFGSLEAYREHEEQVLATGALLDPGMLYFDARLSRHAPTVEVRVCDVCLNEEDAVTIAALYRGLVETAVAEWREGRPPIECADRVLRLANGRAALSGVRGELLDPLAGMTPKPARDALAAMLEHAAPGLAVAGDEERVRAGVETILTRGTGADQQHERYAESGRLEDVVAPEILDYAVEDAAP
ncbi:putative glutamate--cysteine ligase 2 [Microbacterium nanhaiense]|uniref:Putative glutamate--cysteine ligase 2 n=1 Tax=Microbacterium nanhaiense TaxID=1301026 RepID=A0ABQ2N498_9MICO|nr:glutamate--cysteine ligase [Microbacterium nanhaiense]GGO65744.1 putative glutamate--cysteine ligase 2 [Microbacterium nanhaiense]